MKFARDELEFFRALGFDDPDIELLELHQEKGLQELAGPTPESAMTLVNRLRECQKKYGHIWTLTPDLRTLILANLTAEAIEHLENAERAAKIIQAYRQEILIPKIIKEEKSNATRKAADAAHEITNKQKTNAIADWNFSKHQYSSMAGFARNKWRQYGITERTLFSWISEYERKSKK